MKRTLCFVSLIAFAAHAFAASVEGTYTVPAGEGLEEPFDVPLKRARLTVSGDHVEFDYRLPKELDGARPQRFTLAGDIQGDKVALHDTRGDAVTADCTLEASAYVCNMTYNQPFVVRQDAALQYLQSQGTSPADIAKFQRASDSLQHQAAGIVTIPRRP